MPVRPNALQDIQRLLLQLAIDASGHDLERAAHALGITIPALRRELRARGLKVNTQAQAHVRGPKPFEVLDPTGALAQAKVPYALAMELFERTYLRHALRLNSNRSQTGRVLGLSRTTLYRHLNRLRVLAPPEPSPRKRKR